MIKNNVYRLYLTTFVVVSVFFLLSFILARGFLKEPLATFSNVDDLMQALPYQPLLEREKDNQMIIHNVSLFKDHPKPKIVEVGYVGTSRSKLIRPNFFLSSNDVVGAGNSYNEISYGLLLQAEILRLQFPNIKKIFFEASMLLRRPARLIVEEDHRKYYALLKSLEPLCSEINDNKGCVQVFNSLSDVKSSQSFISSILSVRKHARFSSVFSTQESESNIVASESKINRNLQYSGERRNLPRRVLEERDWLPPIKNDNPKVQRLREVDSYGRGDDLFEMIAVWGKNNDIEVVFFQPPVRSDLYEFQVQYGLNHHVNDLKRISEKYKVPFIDLNLPKLGYIYDWSIFSDEDHLETCVGSGLLTISINSENAVDSSQYESSKSTLVDRVLEKCK